eukprot:6158434-Ditylum_brightwellii.AAC.1
MPGKGKEKEKGKFDESSKKKEVSEKTCHGCKDHQAWAIHDPKECTLRQEKLAKEGKGGKGGVTFASVAALIKKKR